VNGDETNDFWAHLFSSYHQHEDK